MTKPARIRRRKKARSHAHALRRRGVVAVLTAFVLVVLFAFAAFAVDTGRITNMQTKLQNAADAAALAAAQEITVAVNKAGDDGSTVTITAGSNVVTLARAMAKKVANANGVYIDPDRDVRFGQRKYDTATGEWRIDWNQEPYNAVQVTVRRDNPDTSQPDGALRLAFGWAVARPTVDLCSHSTAFVESRDMVLVLDYSASMNDDSEMGAFASLGQSRVEKNLDDIWQALVDANIKFPNSTRVKFPSTGFGGIQSKKGTYISSTNKDTVMETLGLNQTLANGSPKYPFPQAGKNSNGDPKGVPNASNNAKLWGGYIEYVQYLNGPYKKYYGYRTLINYLLTQRPQHHLSEDLWRTPHYPAHAVKNGASLFLDFLRELDFGDEVGLVIYDTLAYRETKLPEEGIDISSDPITADYDAIDVMQRRKQAGNEEGWTGMGFGIREARQMLASHARYGAKPMMLVMTDGQTNQRPSGWTLPAGWNWSEFTDFDKDGHPDYTTSDRNKQYAFWEAAEAIKAGITIHTMTVGAEADVQLMRAIAQASGGVSIHIPGGQTIENLESQILEAFAQIASKVPPAKLVYDLPPAE